MAKAQARPRNGQSDSSTRYGLKNSPHRKTGTAGSDRPVDRTAAECYNPFIRNTRGRQPATVRFGVSMDDRLLARFDAELEVAGYTCRSEALRDLVLGWLASRSLRRGKGQSVGVLSFVYDHNRHNLSHRLVHLQHKHHARVVATVHVHLDPSACLEVVILRGRAKILRELADRLTAIKSVQQGNLTLLAEPAAAARTVRQRQPVELKPERQSRRHPGGDAIDHKEGSQ